MEASRIQGKAAKSSLGLWESEGHGDIEKLGLGCLPLTPPRASLQTIPGSLTPLPRPSGPLVYNEEFDWPLSLVPGR